MRDPERIAAGRQKINDGGLLDLLIDHAHGRIELSPSRIDTIFGLLKKIIPDFSNSAPPRDTGESRDDGPPPTPRFEINIVDP
jgi:hypothetical protein